MTPPSDNERNEPGDVAHDSLATRESLLQRLRKWDDAAGWQEFNQMYRKLLYQFALRRGVSPNDVDDVVQETMLSVAKSMPGFRYEPARCSFKGWLRHLAEARIADHFRRKGRRLPTMSLEIGRNESGDWEGFAGGVPVSDSTREAGALWDLEWQEQLLAEAMKRVRAESDPRQFRIFEATVIQGCSGTEVARMLDTNVAVVYVARHRVTRRIAAEVRRLEREMDALLRS